MKLVLKLNQPPNCRYRGTTSRLRTPLGLKVIRKVGDRMEKENYPLPDETLYATFNLTQKFMTKFYNVWFQANKMLHFDITEFLKQNVFFPNRKYSCTDVESFRDPI